MSSTKRLIGYARQFNSLLDSTSNPEAIRQGAARELRLARRYWQSPAYHWTTLDGFAAIIGRTLRAMTEPNYLICSHIVRPS